MGENLNIRDCLTHQDENENKVKIQIILKKFQKSDYLKKKHLFKDLRYNDLIKLEKKDW